VHTPEEQAWDRSDLQQEVEVENVEAHRANRPRGTISISLCHPDISSVVSLGPWELPGSPSDILEAVETHLPDLLRNMEARIPEERRTAFPPVDFWSAILGAGMAVEILVSDCEE